MLGFKNWRHYLQGSKYMVYVISNHNNFRYFITTKKLIVKQIRWAEKLSAFDFIIEYRKKTLNFANASSRRPDIMKPEDGEDVNNDFLSTLRNKLRNQFYQPKLLEDLKVSSAVKLAASTTRLNSNVTADIQTIGLNERVLARRYGVLKVAASQLLVYQVMKSKRFYLKLREPMIV